MVPSGEGLHPSHLPGNPELRTVPGTPSAFRVYLQEGGKERKVWGSQEQLLRGDKANRL